MHVPKSDNWYKRHMFAMIIKTNVLTSKGELSDTKALYRALPQSEALSMVAVALIELLRSNYHKMKQTNIKLLWIVLNNARMKMFQRLESARRCVLSIGLPYI